MERRNGRVGQRSVGAGSRGEQGVNEVNEVNKANG
jgi:hypothetical protein